MGAAGRRESDRRRAGDRRCGGAQDPAVRMGGEGWGSRERRLRHAAAAGAEVPEGVVVGVGAGALPAVVAPDSRAALAVAHSADVGPVLVVVGVVVLLVGGDVGAREG